MKDNDEIRINNLELESLVNEIIGLVIVYLPLITIKKYRLVKKEKKELNRIGKFIHITDNMSLDYSYYDNNVDYNRINSMKYKDIIMNFISTIRNNYPSYILKNFYDNLDYIEVEDRIIALFKRTYSYYNPLNNSIHLAYKEHLYHELLHMATTRYSEEELHVGFSSRYIKDNMGRIGDSLNEGYTELITHRNFSGLGKTYLFETFMAKKIETIIGKEIMEKLYFMSSLEELCKELGKYTKELKDVIKLIYFLDCYKVLKTRKSIKKNRFYLVTIVDTLIKLYLNKLKKDHDQGIIDREELISSLEEYIYEFNNIPRSYKFNYEKEKGISLEDYKNILLEELNLNISKTI